MRKLSFLLSVVTVFLFFFSGCAQKKTAMITSEPTGALVFIDSLESGETPINKELTFSSEKSSYNVRLEKNGYFGKEIEILYKPKELVQYSAVLEKINKKITIKSDPSGAELLLNGKIIGVTPFTDQMFFDQGQEYIFTAKMPLRETGEINVEFEPKDKSDYLIELPEAKEIELEQYEFEYIRTDSGIQRIARPRMARSVKEIIERSPNVKSVTKVTNYEDRTITVGKPVISADGNSLIYSVRTKEIVEDLKGRKNIYKDNKGNSFTYFSNIWKQEIGSPKKSRVTYGKYLDAEPSVNPSGSYIYFSSARNTDNAGIWRIGVDGAGGITKISSGQAEDFQPSCGDGLIVFASNVEYADEPQIWTVTPGSSFVTQLREGDQPCLSQDQRKIYFVRKDERTQNEQIWVMSADGSGETILSVDPEVKDKDPHVSPDGNYIVFSSNAGKDSSNTQNWDIWMMNSDGSNRTQLTTNGSTDDFPVWDPAGRYIYFRSNRGWQSNIWRFEPSLVSSVTKKQSQREPQRVVIIGSNESLELTNPSESQ